ncbi:MAG: type IV pili methyl-accepting chemotaxis transducer N-terminal domain-containing protein [Candidatus Thiodiazotropha sp. (ex Myrtea spinifera)]|nr:type IV pili methyl-accepting chemotaxis transducer N-terminal domain-containing protein [Candidatus Thiodiazotropha sp. (ex Myrtea spinifera)]MCU7828012.1 type IV pili methyl-accepting chemotaxis transducer N-terminal domain-containing protein [Candidatus Thiodiazotropha sp. (ex Myrtea sp. 'scaly one' KF741663)]
MKRSLLLRFGIVISILFVVAVSGMLSSVIIAETAEGYAAAINQAGTLRMQSYRITTSLVHGTAYENDYSANRTDNLVEEYNQRLFSPRIQNVISKGPSQRVTETYQKVERQWQDTILPNLNNYLTYQRAAALSSLKTERITSYQTKHLRLVDNFVDDIHRFVEALEVDAERKNEQLRLLQIALLCLTFILVIVSLYLIKRYVLAPLNDLLTCANAARHGDFSVRSRFLSEDELGQLGQAFNVMAEDLSIIYADLEARVNEKTQDLERSNRTLELLYSATKRLSDSTLGAEVLEAVIHDIEDLMGVDSGTICIGHPGDEQAYRYASTSPRDIVIKEKPDNQCTLCLGRGNSHTFQVKSQGTGDLVNIFSTPIKDKSQQYGVLLIEFSKEMILEPWQERLLETVASHIALAINVAQQVSESRRLSLLEERSVIARELHDSIAQSLSYLKIQVSLLEKAVSENAESTQLLHSTGILRSALNGAYRQLRELLTTFRLRISENELGGAIKTTVDEFSERSGLSIEYLNQIGNCQFTPNAEIHIIQIIREALSNIIRHADATRAGVALQCDQEGMVTVTVEDDGVGIDDQRDMMQHYGLPIMKERAECLGGDLSIVESKLGGTQIKLTFNINNSTINKSNQSFVEQLNNA